MTILIIVEQNRILATRLVDYFFSAVIATAIRHLLTKICCMNKRQVRYGTF